MNKNVLMNKKFSIRFLIAGPTKLVGIVRDQREMHLKSIVRSSCGYSKFKISKQLLPNSLSFAEVVSLRPGDSGESQPYSPVVKMSFHPVCVLTLQKKRKK